MTDPTPPAHPNAPGCLECAELLSLFVGSRLSRDADPRFRELLRACPECRAAYRQTVTQTAKLAQSLRDTRERKSIQRDEARRKRERVANASRAAGMSPRNRRFYLQLMIIPALLLFILGRMGVEQEQLVVAKVYWEGGGVNAGGTLLDDDIPELALTGGDFITLLPGARARIEDDGTVIELQGESTWMVEPAGGRYRIYAGTAKVETERGVVLIAGSGVAQLAANSRVEVSASGGPLSLTCERGSVAWASASVSVELQAGERWPATTAAVRR